MSASAGDVISVAIPAGAAVSLPLAGVPRGSDAVSLQIARYNSHWSNTTLLDTTLCDAQRVGSFSGSSSLAMDPPTAGAPTNLTIRFATAEGLAEYESVHIKLQAFGDSAPVGTMQLSGTKVGSGEPVSVMASYTPSCPPETLAIFLEAGEALAPGELLEVDPTPCTLNPEPCPLPPAPCPLPPAPCPLHPEPCTLNPAP
jgi:hypothetical protein